VFFFCLSLFWFKLHAQHQTPHITSNSTLNIKLLTSHQTPRSTSNSPHHIKLHAQHQTPHITSNSTLPPHNTQQARYNAITIKRRQQPTRPWYIIIESFPPKTPDDD